MSFADIRDQHVPIRFLRRIIERDRIPNGLLFWGPSGVGKHLAALELAKAINCPEVQGDSCGQCLTCRKVANGNHPDVISLAPVKKSRIIDVEAIDGIIELASLKPFESKWRVFVIQEAERMRAPAQNHLLKTLEEPLGNSAFVLISEYPRMLLPTIRSRCQQIRFGALKPETVAELLMAQRDLAPDRAQALAAVSQGQMTRALDLVDSERREAVFDVIQRLDAGEDPLEVAEGFAKYLAGQKTQIEAAVKAQSGPVAHDELSREDLERVKEEQMALVDALTRRDIMEHLYLMETWYRDKLVYSATGDISRLLNQDQLALLDKGSAEGSDTKIEAIDKARLYLERFLSEERVFRDLFFALAS